LYGSDFNAREQFLIDSIKKVDAHLTHNFGFDRGLGVKEVHEIKRRSSLMVGAGGIQVFVIRHADEMTGEAYQAFLKLLEETPSSSMFILVSQSNNLPETILSRLTLFSFFGAIEKDSDLIFSSQIIELKASMERIIRESGKVPHNELNNLNKIIKLSSLELRTRIGKKAIEDYYAATNS
jgi:DNA polymerase III delta prime subunit